MIKTEKLEIGMIVKNYKVMCELLKESVKSGKSKECQLRNWERYFKWHKIGYKFIIDEIYETPKEKIDKRINNGNVNCKNKKYFSSFKINNKHRKSIGIYRITLGGDVYIGSTTVSFRNRFIGHLSKDNKLPTKEMLRNGAIFEIIEICDGKLEPYIRKRENEYIQLYKNMNEYNVVNDRPAWSYTEPKQKYRTIWVNVKEEEYEDAKSQIQNLGYNTK